MQELLSNARKFPDHPHYPNTKKNKFLKFWVLMELDNVNYTMYLEMIDVKVENCMSS